MIEDFDIQEPDSFICPLCGHHDEPDRFGVAGLDIIIDEWDNDNPGVPTPADIRSWCCCPACLDWATPCEPVYFDAPPEPEPAVEMQGRLFA